MLKKKINVCHILYSGLGGAANAVFSLVDQNNKKFYKENLIFTGPSFLKEYKEKAKFFNINFYYFRTIKYLQFLSWVKILFCFLKIKPDIIFIHNYQLIPAIIYKLIFSKKILYIDHWNTNTQKVKKRIVAIIIKLFADRIVVLNSDNYNFYKKKIKIKKERILLIPNGINLKFYQNNKIKKKQKIFKIGMATRLDGIEKIPELIINALKTNILRDCKIIFYLAGEGQRRLSIKNHIDKCKLNNSCILNGYLNEIQLKKWFKNLDLYVHPTLGEAMSISILQAMSMNVPVLASNVSGVNNIIGRKQYVGLLFENNKNDLAKKIKIFYFMNLKRKLKIVKEQKKYIIKNYSSHLIFDKYKKLILNLNK